MSLHSFISTDVFNATSDYLIPRSELCGKIIALYALDPILLNDRKLGELYMVGYPIELTKEKYQRKCIEFNLGIMLDREEYERREAVYSALLKKVGKVLVDLEEECEFVWSERYKTEISKIVRTIYEDLQRQGWMHCEITGITSLDARLQPLECRSVFRSVQVRDFDVPILLRPAIPASITDMGVLKVAESIDGVRCVKHLAAVGSVHIGIVKKSVGLLMNLDCAALIDIFQYCNSYLLRKEFAAFLASAEKQEECCRCIGEFPEKFKSVPELYQALVQAKSVGDFIKENAATKTNVRMLVAYGVVNRLIRRVHHYVYVKEEMERQQLAKDLLEDAHVAGGKDERKRLRREIAGMLNGTGCLDAICCKLGLSQMTVREAAAEYMAVVFPK